MRTDPKTKTLMGILGLASSILFAFAAYHAFQAHIHLTNANNLRDGTQLEPGLTLNVTGLIVISIVVGFASLALLIRSAGKGSNSHETSTRNES